MAALEINGGSIGTSEATSELNIALVMGGDSISTSLVSGNANIGLVAAGTSVGMSVVTGNCMMKFGASGTSMGTSAVIGGMNIAMIATGASVGMSAVSGNVEMGLMIAINYFGTQEVGLGSPEGSRFDIVITGSFSVLSITMNGKTLTYTDAVISQTIKIDNVAGTVKIGATNKLSKVTGDVSDFLKLIPGDNIITITKIGGDCTVLFDFRPQYL